MQFATSSESFSSSRDYPHKYNVDNKEYTYKKSSYKYSSPERTTTAYTTKTMDQNIDQLDALLEDLKNERSKEQELGTAMKYTNLDREVYVPVETHSNSTSSVVQTRRQKAYQNFDSLPSTSATRSNIIRTDGNFNYYDDHQTQERIYEKKYPSDAYRSKTEIYQSNRTLENNDIALPSSSSTAANIHLEKDLKNITLTEDILPQPGTKVTTTVRTYTYEVPSNISNTLHLSKNINYNTLNRTDFNTISNYESSVPQTMLRKNESYKVSNVIDEVPVYTNQSYEVVEHRERNSMNTSNNISPRLTTSSLPGGPNNRVNTVVYNVSSTQNRHIIPDNNHPSSVPDNFHQTPYAGPIDGVPNVAPGPTSSRYFYKESVHTVRGSNNNPPYEVNPNLPQSKKPLLSSPPVNAYPNHVYPDSSTTVHKYSTNTTTTQRTTNYGGHMPETPAPFPVDGTDFSNANPPQKVDDLLQTLGTPNSVSHEHVEAPIRKREIETGVALEGQQMIPSVNKAGREVYYPPGHDTILMKREEMSAGSAAGGRWAKGSGMYEYESGSRSKVTSKSGGAMVPVCLPLCCAMPCSIM